MSIDDRPDAPVATPATRRAIAIKWHWTTNHTVAEIARALGVTERTVKGYLASDEADEVRKAAADLEADVRTTAVLQLKSQLQAAGHRSRTATTPVEVWRGESDAVQVYAVTDGGEVVDRRPVAADVDLAADQEARADARGEVRDILEQVTALVGAAGRS